MGSDDRALQRSGHICGSVWPLKAGFGSMSCSNGALRILGLIGGIVLKSAGTLLSYVEN